MTEHPGNYQAQRVTDAQVAELLGREPPPERPPSNLEYLADSVDRCKYLDLKQAAADVMKDRAIASPADLADAWAEWANRVLTKQQA